jgi:hypothetical protein
MPQFNLQLSDTILRPDDEASVQAFAARTDWAALPSSAQLHGSILGVLLHSDVYDSHLVAEGLRLLAAQRMALYAGRLTGTAELPLWLGWLERIEELKSVDDPVADLDLAKKELKLSIELIEHAKELIPTDEPASRVLYASGCEISEATDVRTVGEISERMQRAKAIAQIAKHGSFDEHGDASKVSAWSRFKAGLFRASKT